ncbi:hypothetical protein [Pantoea sp. 18069]|uniref:hypothetical protein n=1 Tax=Pantoea sp. 18069 TaxID=2681415 RepID=UPI0013571C90|nr:hypothetical protein [Pantoea sp. 18069]
MENTLGFVCVTIVIIVMKRNKDPLWIIWGVALLPLEGQRRPCFFVIRVEEHS